MATSAPGKPWNIYIVPAEGGSPQELLPAEHSVGDPHWSPDGHSLVFGDEPILTGGGFAARPMAIHVLDLRTHQVSTLPGSEGLFSPRWSPDGRYIAAQPADQTKLLVYDFTPQKWDELVEANADYFNWSRDGRYICLNTNTGEPAFLRVRMSDHKMERVVSLKDLRLAPGVFGPWVGTAPDDSPLLLRDVGIQEIYALDVQWP